MENKIYQQCREEAKKIIRDKYLLKFNTQYVGLYQDEINQLTAEIYGMKLLELSSKYNLTTIHGVWCLNNKEIFSLTQDLHDHFVREFNVSLTNEGNNSKQ